jgi:peptidoglycan/LPS O-acetylase OafA/YrhL
VKRGGKAVDWQAAAPTARSPYRLFGAFRFGLALMVVAGHALQLAGDGPLQALRPWGLGNIAVMVFFVLSGFIISEAMDLFYRGRAGFFLANRSLRILPPYFAALGASIVFHILIAKNGGLLFFDYDQAPPGMFGSTNLLSNLLSIIVLYGLGHVGMQPDYLFVRYLWAVRVEIHFYLVFALIYFLVWRYQKKAMSFRPGAGAPSSIAVGGVIFFILLFGIADVTKHSFLNYFQFVPYFLLGVCLYHGLTSASRWAFAGLWLGLFLSVYHFIGYVGKSADNAVLGPILLLIMLISLIIPLSRVGGGGFVGTLDRSLGDLSYSLYLNHYVVTIVFLSLLKTRGPAIYIACILASIAFSWGMNLVTEPLTRQIRDRLRGVSL